MKIRQLLACKRSVNPSEAELGSGVVGRGGIYPEVAARRAEGDAHVLVDRHLQHLVRKVNLPRG